MTLNCMLTDIVNLLYNKQKMHTKQGSRSTEIEMTERKKTKKKQDIKKWGEKQQLNSLRGILFENFPSERNFPFTYKLSNVLNESP